MSAVRLLPLMLAALVAGTACTGSRQAPEGEVNPAKAGSGADAVTPTADAAREGGEARRLFEALDAHCGRAFPGVVEAGDGAVDPAWSAGAPVLHVRACEPNLKALSVVRGDDRSLVWLLTVREGRLRLQHLSYNDDATPRPDSGRFSIARADNPVGRVEFDAEIQDSANPAPPLSLAIDADALVYERGSGDDRLRVRFDLGRSIPAPPVPWMEAPVR